MKHGNGKRHPRSWIAPGVKVSRRTLQPIAVKNGRTESGKVKGHVTVVPTGKASRLQIRKEYGVGGRIFNFLSKKRNLDSSETPTSQGFLYYLPSATRIEGTEEEERVRR